MSQKKMRMYNPKFLEKTRQQQKIRKEKFGNLRNDFKNPSIQPAGPAMGPKVGEPGGPTPKPGAMLNQPTQGMDRIKELTNSPSNQMQGNRPLNPLLDKKPLPSNQTIPSMDMIKEQSRTIGPAQQEQEMKTRLMPNNIIPKQDLLQGGSKQQSQADQSQQEAPQSTLPAGQQPQNAAPMGQPPQGAEAPAQDSGALDQQIAALQKQIADLQAQKK